MNDDVKKQSTELDSNDSWVRRDYWYESADTARSKYSMDGTFTPHENSNVNMQWGRQFSQINRTKINNIPEKRILEKPDWRQVVIRNIDRDHKIKKSDEVITVCERIAEVIELREKWVYKPKNGNCGAVLTEEEISLDLDKMKFPKSIEDKYEIIEKNGVFNLQNKITGKKTFNVYTFGEYLDDLKKVLDLRAFGPAKSLCYKRLQILTSRFTLHYWLNNDVETKEAKGVPYRDFYNVRKIDNHIHHSACMHQKHLLRFMREKLETDGNRVVLTDSKTKKDLTLKQVFNQIGITADELSIDLIDVHAKQDTFHRFDRFNQKYNPIGKSELRTIFLKVENKINGKYLADITKEVMDQLKANVYHFSEYRLSIYGKNKKEWDTLSKWIVNNNLHCAHVRWLIQIPRIYNVWKKIGLIKNFYDMIDNIFRPLFEVTLNPESHPELHLFLNIVVGFDSVDDESTPEVKRAKYPVPRNYDMSENPPYLYWLYYLWANLYTLNKLREERGLNTFALRPHCGEAGSDDHLASAFLLAHGINHGIVLHKVPVLQYLYYIKQIAISMSPLSNNILFDKYDNNPFPKFFKRGLNVALSTDDPLLIHYTKDPLLEEYSIAAQVYSLSPVDLCEVARNSVIQSGWDLDTKKKFIGDNFNKYIDSRGNDIHKTNVPDCRIDYRSSILTEELNFIKYKGYESVEYEKRQSSIRKSIVGGSNSPDFKLLEQLNQQNPSILSEDEEDIAAISPLSSSDIILNKHKRQKTLSELNSDGNKSKIRKSEMKNIAIDIAKKAGVTDLSKQPMHEEWLKIAEEKKKLQMQRIEMNKIIEKMKGMDQVLDTNDKKLMEKKKKGIKISMYGDYFSGKNQPCSIEKTGLSVNGSKKLKITKIKKSDQYIKFQIELSNLDAKLTQMFGDTNTDTLKCKLDIQIGELTFANGIVWFKNDNELLKGFWEDQDKNSIEINIKGEWNYVEKNKKNEKNQIKIVGFKTIQLIMNDGKIINGKMFDEQTIKLQSGDIWERAYKSECIVM